MRFHLLRSLRWVMVAMIFPGLAWAAPNREAVMQRARVELATTLKKEAAKLPLDKPVTELGADELNVVEWVMALEEAFRVEISEENVTGRSGKGIRPDLTITVMAGIVMDQVKDGAVKKGGAGK